MRNFSGERQLPDLCICCGAKSSGRISLEGSAQRQRLSSTREGTCPRRCRYEIRVRLARESISWSTTAAVRLDEARSRTRFVVPLGVSSICRVARFFLVGLIQGGGPAGEKGQPILRRTVGFGAVSGKCQPGVGRKFHDLVGEAEVAFDGVTDSDVISSVAIPRSRSASRSGGSANRRCAVRGPGALCRRDGCSPWSGGVTRSRTTGSLTSLTPCARFEKQPVLPYPFRDGKCSLSGTYQR